VTTAIEIAAIFGRAAPPKVNLALAGIKKVGASVDLPIALGRIADSRVRLSERTSGHAMTIIARSPSPSLVPAAEAASLLFHASLLYRYGQIRN
jgi:hypothetical protein